MAVIRAFRGMRYADKAGKIDKLTAPPYDVLSPAQREEFAARSPHNVVYLTLPEQEADDRSKFVKYARSAARLSEWRREGVLALEETPVFYRYSQFFGHGERVRTSLIALIKVEPYSAGVVLPHEETFPKHKEDRLRILEATRAHLECIFGLYEDPDSAVLQTLQGAPCGDCVETTSDEGVKHVLEPIRDAATIQALTEALASKKVWIADGHHRYETALAFRQSMPSSDQPIAEDFMMMALTSMSDPGLVLLPTHRIVNAMPLSRDAALAALGSVFETESAHSSQLTSKIASIRNDGGRAFGVAFEGGLGYVLTPRDEQALVAMVPGDGSLELKGLDVSILHHVILEKLLGIVGLDNIRYTRDYLEAVRAADEGAAAAFLMNPPTVSDMKQIALGGEKMPQKSTYYYPKILSGLVLWSLNDF